MMSRSLIKASVPLARRVIGVNTPSVCVMSSRLAHDGPPAHYKHPTMDELPVPCGSWQEHYDNNQRRYNIHLLLGAGFFLITFTVGIYSGSFDMYLWAPEKPAPRQASK